jgi:predicted secreted protein
MSAMSGTNGKVMQGANTVANMTSWDVDLKAGQVDISAFGGSGWGAFLGTIKTWSGKMSGNYDPADTNGQVALNAGLGNTFTVAFYTDGTHNWSGSAVLTDISFKSSAAGVITADYSFNGAGALTYA